MYKRRSLTIFWKVVNTWNNTGITASESLRRLSLFSTTRFNRPQKYTMSWPRSSQLLKRRKLGEKVSCYKPNLKYWKHPFSKVKGFTFLGICVVLHLWYEDQSAKLEEWQEDLLSMICDKGYITKLITSCAPGATGLTTGWVLVNDSRIQAK